MKLKAQTFIQKVVSRALSYRSLGRPFSRARIIEIVTGVLIILQIGIITINGFDSHVPILGLRAEGKIIGNLHEERARQQIVKLVVAHENRKIHIKAGTFAGIVTPRQFGARSDGSQYLHVLSLGRSGSILRRLVEQDRAAFGFYDISLPGPVLNTDIVSAYIDTVNRTVPMPPVNAYYKLEGDHVAVIPGKEGQVIDKKRAIELINAGTGSRGDPNVELPIEKKPPVIQDKQLEALLPKVQAVTARPVTITAANQQVVIPREALIAMLEVTVNGDKQNNKAAGDLSFNEAKLNTYVDTATEQAKTAPIPTVATNGKVYRQGTPGLQGEDDHPVVRVLTLLLQREAGVAVPDVVTLPMRKIDPPAVPLAALPPSEQLSLSKGVPSAAPAQSPKNNGTVYLTIDDGPGQYTSEVLDILKRYGVHATFYVIGRNAERYPDQVKRMLAEGHTVGNHSFSHSDLTKLIPADMQLEIQNTQSTLKKISGSSPTLFRPPYGAQNPSVISFVSSLGLTSNLWSVDPQDWAQPGSNVIVNRVVAGAGPGSVVLLHVLHHQTIDALPGIIEALRAKGYSFP